MLASKPEEAQSVHTSGHMPPPQPKPSPAAAPSAPATDLDSTQQLEELVSYLVASPEFKDAIAFSSPSMDLETFLTSPMPALGHDFDDVSPRETPLNDFLNTPLFETSDSPLLADDAYDFEGFGHDSVYAPFSGLPLFESAPVVAKPPPSAAPNPAVVDGLIPFSPETPNIDSFAYGNLPLPPIAQQLPTSSATTTPAPTAPPMARRRSSATGTRKGITPAALVPLDAPTQARKYTTPSATSRKELPMVFARKRAHSVAFEGDDETADGTDAALKEQIEYKRRQNTVAARKSRARKLETQRKLEAEVQQLTRERDNWRTRALTFQGLLGANGIPFEPFRD